MPVKRKMPSSFGRRTRRKYWKKARRSMIVSKPAYKRIHSFKRVVNGANITVDTASTTAGALTFSLSSLASYTEFTALYDQFRITGIKVEFRPRLTGSDANPMTTMVQYGDLVTAIDHNDNTAPTTQNELYQYSTVKTTPFFKGQTRFIRPSVLLQAYESAVATAYAPKWRQWLDTNDSATPHYGLKYWFAPSSSLTPTTIGVIITYYFQCKNTK